MPTASLHPAPAAVWRYGLLGLPLAFAALPLYVHLPRLYAEAGGLDLAMLGALLLVARLFDAVIDPWLGTLADRFSRRTLMLVFLPVFAAGFAAVLQPPERHVAIWLLAALLVTYVGYSAVSVAYQSWGADLGRSADERTRLTAAREGWGLIGVIAAASLPGLLATDLAAGLARLAWSFVPILLICAALSLTLPAPALRASVSPGLASLRAALTDAVFSRLLAVFVVNGVAAALPATLVLFFVADVLDLAAWSGAFLALYFIAAVAGMPIWVRAARRWGRASAWLAGMALSMLGFAGTWTLGSGDGAAFAFICVASGLALGADLVLPAAMAADRGERLQRAGACFGWWNLFAKLNLALAAGIALPLLGWLGYQPGQTGGEAALAAAYALLPLVFKALAFGLLWQWRRFLQEES